MNGHNTATKKITGSSPVKNKKLQIAQNEATLLRHIRSHQGVSRIELASLMGIAPSTTGILCTRLLEEGFLLESETVKLKKGRPRTVLNLNPVGGYMLGVDYEANHVRAVCLNFNEDIEKSVSIKTKSSDGVKKVLRIAEEAIQSILPQDSDRILGLGIAVPGLVNRQEGTGVSYKYISGWENVPLVDHFTECFGLPVYLEDNIRAMASAELWFGKGRMLNQFICIGVRSGIGIGIVTHGQIYNGAHEGAGEVGSWHCPSFILNESANPTGKPYVELEEVASVRAVLKNIKTTIEQGQPSELSEHGPDLTIDHVIEAYRQNDTLAVETLNIAANALGWLTGQVSLVLDPGKIILAGPFMQLGKPFLDRIRSTAAEHMHMAQDIEASELGEFNGAIGAAAQIVHHWVPV